MPVRSETKAIDRTTCHLRYQPDWLSFVQEAEQVRDEARSGSFNGLGCASLKTGDAQWYGTASLDEAIQLAYRGWPEGREKIRSVRERLGITQLFPLTRKFSHMLDVAGEEPDIDAYLQGDPENMLDTHIVTEVQRGKIIRLIVERSNSAYVTTEEITRRGVAVLAMMETCILLGYSIDLQLVFSVDRGDHHFEEYVPICAAGDPINLDSFAYWIMHPAVLRRIDFAAEENEPNEIRHLLDFIEPGSYGRPTGPLFTPDHDLYIGGHDSLLSHDDEIIPRAIEYLAKVGIKAS